MATPSIIMLFASMGFIALLIVPALLDHRFGWSAVPLSVVTIGDTHLVFLVYKENTFSSATIEVAENQKVISSGPTRRRPPVPSLDLLDSGS
jgi:hypothetical protein